jgi:hypothetical protein
MFGINYVELLVIGAVMVLVLGSRLPPPPARARLGKVDDFIHSARFDGWPVPFRRMMFIVAVMIETVLNVIVVYDRYIR